MHKMLARSAGRGAETSLKGDGRADHRAVSISTPGTSHPNRGGAWGGIAYFRDPAERAEPQARLSIKQKVREPSQCPRPSGRGRSRNHRESRTHSEQPLPDPLTDQPNQ